MDRDILSDKTVKDLRTIAKTIGVKGISTKRKSELVEEIISKSKDDRKKAIEKEKKQVVDKLSYVKESKNLDLAEGILEIIDNKGYGFLRFDNYLPSDLDIYVSPSQITKFKLRTGDKILGYTRKPKRNENFGALLRIKSVNGQSLKTLKKRPSFDDLTPIYPTEKYVLEISQDDLATRIIDLMAPIGKGQRGLIVAPPKAGKTILLQKIAKSISIRYPDSEIIILLIDERPEEVTEMKRMIDSDVIYSTFDERPENHIRVAEMVINRAKALVEQKKDVVVLLDSITRLTRAYNLTTSSSGKTLSGGLDPYSLYKPKRFFGAARNIEEGGSLTIVATALIETGSRMDDVIFEEFKGTGNMEVRLDRKLSEKRIFPAIDIHKSGTRREELLLDTAQKEVVWAIRRDLDSKNPIAVTEEIIKNMINTETNKEFIRQMRYNIK